MAADLLAVTGITVAVLSTLAWVVLVLWATR